MESDTEEILNYCKNSKKFSEGVAVVFYSLNSAQDIGDCLKSIKDSKIGQLIVTDGSSTDNSCEIAESLGAEVVVGIPGILNQRKKILEKVKYKYFLEIEADQRFPPSFVENLLSAFKESPYIAAQATLKAVLKENYWQRGFSAFHEFHFSKPGPVSIIGGPAIHYTEFMIDKIASSMKPGEVPDAAQAELIQRLGLKMGLLPVIAYQHEDLDFKTFWKKHFWYGKGDNDFYQEHKAQWSLSRRLLSLTHPFRRYFIHYPLQVTKQGKPQFIFYFWLSAIARYTGWIYHNIADVVDFSNGNSH